MFGRQRRAAWADLARHAEIAARFATGERSPALLREAAALGDRLAAAKWPVAPHEARLLAGRIAADLNRHEQARALFEQVARHRHRGVAEIRALAWHAQALHALSTGRPTAAEQALRAGLRVHAENNAVLGATDLRAHAAARGEELATLGLRLALERGDARAVLRWAETWRAASLRRRPVRPPDDQQLAADLAQLRRVVAELAEMEAPTTRSASRPEVSRLNAERLRLEAAVRDRSRYARGAYAPEPPFSPAALAAALGGRVLVEFVRLDDELHAVTVRDGVVRRHRLGSYEAVLRQLDVVRFTMNRMSRRFGSPAMQKAAVQAYDHSRAVLDGLLFGPVRGAMDGAGRGDRRAAGDRADRVAARAAVDGAADVCGAGGERDAVGSAVAGGGEAPCEGLARPRHRLWRPAAAPAPARAPSELGDRRRHRPDGRPRPGARRAGDRRPGRPLPGRRRPVRPETPPPANAARALDGATLAHVATHGRFRADHPLFSSLDAHDGPLYVYDLERLGSTPQMLVLSACESALSGVRPGDELMGLASAVFALGTRTLIASVTPVDDSDTRTLMLALHAALAAGRPPGRGARRGVGGDRDRRVRVLRVRGLTLTARRAQRHRSRPPPRPARPAAPAGRNGAPAPTRPAPAPAQQKAKARTAPPAGWPATTAQAAAAANDHAAPSPRPPTGQWPRSRPTAPTPEVSGGTTCSFEAPQTGGLAAGGLAGAGFLAGGLAAGLADGAGRGLGGAAGPGLVRPESARANQLGPVRLDRTRLGPESARPESLWPNPARPGSVRRASARAESGPPGSARPESARPDQPSHSPVPTADPDQIHSRRAPDLSRQSAPPLRTVDPDQPPLLGRPQRSAAPTQSSCSDPLPNARSAPTARPHQPSPQPAPPAP